MLLLKIALQKDTLLKKLFMRCLQILFLFIGAIPTVHLDFNKNSFLSLHDFESHEELIEKIKEIDQDDQKYQEMLD